MSPSSPRPKARRTSVATEEERAWISFYQRVGHDAALAAEVLVQLDADLELKRAHLALYLSCRESLRSQAAREQRNERIGRFVRQVFRSVFVAMPASAGRRFRRGGDIAVACLPERSAEPALAQVQRLAADPEFGPARSGFVARPPVAPPPAATDIAAPAAGRSRSQAAE